MFALGLVDPKTAFTKAEPHPLKKVLTKRWRLIWVHSYVDSTIQRMLHSSQNETDVLAYHAGLKSASTIGLGHDDDGIQRFGRELEILLQAGHGVIKSADASGWDMSVSADSLWLDTIRRTYLTPCQLHAEFLYIEGFCNSAHIIYDGQYLWASYRFGLTASGVPSASYQNSFIRAFLAIVCGAKDALANGDDLLFAGEVDDELERSFGIIPDPPAVADGKSVAIPFTSFLWTYERQAVSGNLKWTARYDNFPKLLCRLGERTAGGLDGSQAPTPHDTIEGQRFVLRSHTLYDAVYVELLKHLNFTVCEPLDHGL
eukprot:Skav232073  [mRNA]  locus=scaffold1176:448072:449016:- [translate_table: standard]